MKIATSDRQREDRLAEAAQIKACHSLGLFF